MVLISHNLVDVFEVVDRIAVLWLGRNAGVFGVRDTTRRRSSRRSRASEYGRNGERAADAPRTDE